MATKRFAPEYRLIPLVVDERNLVRITVGHYLDGLKMPRKGGARVKKEEKGGSKESMRAVSAKAKGKGKVDYDSDLSAENFQLDGIKSDLDDDLDSTTASTSTSRRNNRGAINDTDKSDAPLAASTTFTKRGGSGMAPPPKSLSFILNPVPQGLFLLPSYKVILRF